MYLTADLPGTGGLTKAEPEDFLVEEIPSYLPSGQGEHTYLLMEKRGLTTEEAIGRLARAFKVAPREIGAAGMKDRQAVTRQWISVPRLDPESALALSGALAAEGISILEARRHGNKLKTGHLRGNRFTITLRGTTDGVERARAILEVIGRRGMPNRFGAQRFGRRGDNAEAGRALVRGEKVSAGFSQRRLFVSAYQSLLFNRYLDRRMADGLLETALIGDVMKKTDTGGLFIVDEAGLVEAEDRRARGAIVPTGPMFGSKMMAPPAGTPAAAREAEILGAEGLEPASFARLGDIAEGTRRPLLVPLGDPKVEPAGTEGSIRISFALPAGAYATEVLAEVIKAA